MTRGWKGFLAIVDQPDVIVVGAGICGLTAAAELKALGKRAVVLDKGRSVGGRLATRRVGDGLADSGAQFFTVRGPEFGAQVAEWVAEGLVFEWSRGWSDGSLTTVREGHPRYAVKGGMNQLPRRLAQGLSIRLLQVITAVRAIEGGWQVELANGERTSARAILLTPPVPQSLDLLKEGGVQLPAITLEELNRLIQELPAEARIMPRTPLGSLLHGGRAAALWSLRQGWRGVRALSGAAAWRARRAIAARSKASGRGRVPAPVPNARRHDQP